MRGQRTWALEQKRGGESANCALGIPSVRRRKAENPYQSASQTVSVRSQFIDSFQKPVHVAQVNSGTNQGAGQESRNRRRGREKRSRNHHKPWEDHYLALPLEFLGSSINTRSTIDKNTKLVIHFFRKTIIDLLLSIDLSILKQYEARFDRNTWLSIFTVLLKFKFNEEQIL